MSNLGLIILNQSDKILKSGVVLQQLFYIQIVEVFYNGYLLVKSFSSSCLYHKLTRYLMRLQHLQRSQYNLFVKWVSSYYLPMVKSWQTKGLPNCVNSQISLKAQGLDTGNQGFNDIVRCSNFGYIVLYCASPFG